MSDPRDAHERSQALADATTGSDAGAVDAPAGAPSQKHTAAGDGRSDPRADAAGDEPTPEQVGAPAPPGADTADEAETPAQAAETDEPVEAGEPDDTGEPVEDELTRALRERDEYLDHLRRERAEFDNFRKRAARDKLEAMDRGIQSLITELLGVLDDFGHVLAASEDSSDPALAKGAALVHGQLTGVLTRFGLEEVPGEGEPFDPQWHEAMMQVPADDDVDEPVVAQVLRPGYRFKGRVIRPASVSVAQ